MSVSGTRIVARGPRLSEQSGRTHPITYRRTRRNPSSPYISPRGNLSVGRDTFDTELSRWAREVLDWASRTGAHIHPITTAVREETPSSRTSPSRGCLSPERAAARNQLCHMVLGEVTIYFYHTAPQASGRYTEQTDRINLKAGRARR